MASSWFSLYSTIHHYISHTLNPTYDGLFPSSVGVEARWNVKAHAQKRDFVFRRNGRVHLNRQGPQFSRLLAADLCASAVVMLDTPRSEVVWRVLATHSIRQFNLHFPSCTSPRAITFQLESTTDAVDSWRWRRICIVEHSYKLRHLEISNLMSQVAYFRYLFWSIYKVKL